MIGLTHVASTFEVLELSVRRTDNLPEHVAWYAGYAPEVELQDDYRLRVVIATLHAGAHAAAGSVTVSALFNELSQSSPDPETLADQIRESDALEGLYDFSKAILQPALAQVGGTWTLPVKSPEPELDVLQRVGDDSEDEGGSPGDA